MDPLSVTASMVTLITVSGSILQYLGQTRARMNPSLELLAIMNTVTDLQGTLIMARGEYNALRDSRIPAARETYQNLPDILERLQGYLDELIDFARTKLLKNGKIPRLGLSEQKKRQLVVIRDNISDAHRNLQMTLNTMSVRQNRELYSKIGEVAIVLNKHHNQTSAKLDRIEAQMRVSHDSTEDDLKVHQHTRSEVQSVLEQAVYNDNNRMGDEIQITTIMPLKACEAICKCQCHVSGEYRTPKWLSSVVGTMFYSSTKEIAAFDKLLEKKAIPVDQAKDLDDNDKEHDIDEEKADCFVDAVEDVSFSNEVDPQAALAVAACL
ncbi:hypothetical protein BS50DRAFT_628829 [Corynespora cassiicola Philippines]|uniref:Fungal N-terminal domain-containing protein n=1 Tax=Corynespora cassiicola Philippines TaxID=1448308 RepID=A0A2T2P4S8_CORCC|nr:hypothetical protein BS50DRAFT_628829 [Corynespora cassiicola Philippines]